MQLGNVAHVEKLNSCWCFPTCECFN